MHFEEKIIYILRQCKIDENLLQKILKGGGPAKFDDIWWKQQILHLLPSDEAAEIAELLAKKRAFDSASVENPQFISIMEGAVYEMHKKHWDDAAMLTYIYKISPPGVQAILLKRIKQLDPFFQNKAVVVVWGVIIVLAVALWFYFNY